MTARQLGYGGLPLILVPPSFERMTHPSVDALAAGIADTVIDALTA